MTDKTTIKAIIPGIIIVLLLTFSSVNNQFLWLNLKTHDVVLNVDQGYTWEPNSLVIHNHQVVDETTLPVLSSVISALNTLDPKAVIILLQSDAAQMLIDKLETPVQVARIKRQGTTPNQTNSLNAVNILPVDGIYRLAQPDLTKDSLVNSWEDTSLTYTDNSPLFINYFMSVDSIPNMTLRQASRGSLIDSLVEDKVVLIDLEYSTNQQRFFIPGNQSSGYLSFGMLQSLAAESLLSDTTIKELSVSQITILFTSCFLLTFFCLQLLSVRIRYLIIVLFILLTWSCFYIALTRFSLLIPAAELVLIQLTGVLLFIATEQLNEKSLIGRLLAQLNMELSKKIQPKSFYQVTSPWENLHILINQQLNLNRSIFLEKVIADHRVKEIHALNCSLDDIEEMRRDYERQPYSDAIENLKPVKLVHRQYFKGTKDTESEYLIPFVFAGNVMGFWALSVNQLSDNKQALFESNLASFGAEIAEILFHRKQFRRQEAKERNPIRRFFDLKMAWSDYESLSTSIGILEKRYDMLQDVFDGMSSAAVLYNLFGQLLYANEVMEDIAQRLDTPVYTLTIHDFLLQITAHSSDELKKYLLNVTIHHQSVDLQLRSDLLQGNYILKIRSINIDDSDKSGDSSFLTMGILLEFIDFTRMQSVLSVRSELVNHFIHQSRNNISKMNLICRRLRKTSTTPENEWFTELERTLLNAEQVTSNVEGCLNTHYFSGHEITPVNIIRLVNDTISHFHHIIEQKSIQLQTRLPTLLSLALIQPEQFTSLLQQTFKLMTEDASSHDSVLSISINDTETSSEKRHLTVIIENQGYGMPKQELDAMLNESPGESGNSDSIIEELLKMMNLVNAWGATTALETELGAGYRMKILLPAFIH